jgi:hypothetical protein
MWPLLELISLAGATHRGLLQRPVHVEDGPEEALHPRWMHHHLPLCKQSTHHDTTLFRCDMIPLLSSTPVLLLHTGSRDSLVFVSVLIMMDAGAPAMQGDGYRVLGGHRAAHG